MNCPHCNKVIVVKLMKDSNVGQAAPATNGEPATYDIGELLEMIEDSGLDEKSQEFVADKRKKYKQYGAKTYVSEKQLAWLKRLAGVAEEEWP